MDAILRTIEYLHSQGGGSATIMIGNMIVTIALVLGTVGSAKGVWHLLISHDRGSDDADVFHTTWS